MQITKIHSWEDMPPKVCHCRYRMTLPEAIAEYKSCYGSEPGEVWLTDDGFVAIAINPVIRWGNEGEE